MIAFSMYIYWAPELIIQDSINLFEKYNVKSDDKIINIKSNTFEIKGM